MTLRFLKCGQPVFKIEKFGFYFIYLLFLTELINAKMDQLIEPKFFVWALHDPREGLWMDGKN